MKPIHVPLLLAILLWGSTQLNAIQFEFKNKTFTPENNQITVSGMLTNPGDKLYAGELFIYKTSFDENGKEFQSKDPSEDFIAYPETVILQPGGSQFVQVNYMGSPPQNSQLYCIVLEQAKLNASTKTSLAGNSKVDGNPISMTLSLLSNYKTYFYVSVPDATSDITITDSQIHSKENKKSLHVNLNNTGNAITRISKTSLRISEKDTPSQYTILNHKTLSKPYLIEPNNQLKLSIPFSSEIEFNNPVVSIESTKTTFY